LDLNDKVNAKNTADKKEDKEQAPEGKDPN